MVRAEVVARGGSAAVNLSANVTDIVVLAGGERDGRIARAASAGVRIHRGAGELEIQLSGVAAAPSPVLQAVLSAAPDLVSDVDALAAERVVAPILPRGGVIDLPPGSTWTVNAAWRADALATGAEVDVVAFLLDEHGQVDTDRDFVFYNAPVSEDGAVALSLDGDSEQSMRLDLGLFPEHCQCVVIAAVVNGGSTFGDLGAVTLSVDGDDATAVTATLDAGTTETTMLLAELYLRRERWRIRVMGQGYDDGLAELAGRYGVEVD